MWRRFIGWGLVLAVLAAGLWHFRPDDNCAPFRAPGAEVWLALGQSNAANHGETRFAGRPGVFTFDGRRCRPARDPLPGASGARGTVWVPLANRWIAEGRAARVLIVARAVSSTDIAMWLPGGALFGRVAEARGRLALRRLSVTRVLWAQGESDAALGTGRDVYARDLGRIVAGLRRIDIGAPVYVVLSGECGASRSPAVRDAQADVLRLPGVRAGPDTDAIGPDRRFEKCHFTGAGQIEAARLWDAALARDLPR